MLKGFLANESNDIIADDAADAETCLTPPETKQLFNFINTLFRVDVAFYKDFEMRVREGTDTDNLSGSKEHNCGGGDSFQDKRVAEAVQAHTAKTSGLPDQVGPSEKQLEELIEIFEPADLEHKDLKFCHCDGDIVGEELDRLLGDVNQVDVGFISDVLSAATKEHEKLIKYIKTRPKDSEEISIPGGAELMQALEKADDHPIINKLQTMLKPRATGVPVRRSVQDKILRQMVLKEALIRCARKHVMSTVAGANALDSKTGGMMATPSGWTLTKLDSIPPETIRALFGSSMSGCAPMYMPNTILTKEARKELRGLEDDNIFKPISSSNKKFIKSAWITLESINQERLPHLSRVLLLLGAIHFELNKKASCYLQIPIGFLIDIITLDSGERTGMRLECGRNDMDNGRIITSYFCLEDEGSKPLKLVITRDSVSMGEKTQLSYRCSEGGVIISQSRGSSSYYSREGEPGMENGATAILITMHAKGLLK